MLPNRSPLHPQAVLQPLGVLTPAAELRVAGPHQLHPLHQAVNVGLGDHGGDSPPDLAGDDGQLLRAPRPAALQPDLAQPALGREIRW